MATIEHRKVFGMNRKSTVITLPIAWVRYYGIQAGDVLEVVTGDGMLTIKVPDARLAQTRETVAEGA